MHASPCSSAEAEQLLAPESTPDGGKPGTPVTDSTEVAGGTAPTLPSKFERQNGQVEPHFTDVGMFNALSQLG